MITRMQRLAIAAVGVAQDEIGNGEIGKNNMGPHIERFTGRRRALWCAGFVGYCYERAALELDIALPFRRSLSAKRLTRNVAAAGNELDLDDDPRAWPGPGDVICWHRGIRPWHGHVALVAASRPNFAIDIIEGNMGAFPAPVRRVTMPYARWTRRLCRIARIW